MKQEEVISHLSIRLINGEAGSHIQVTATATSVPLCPAFSPFGKRSPMPENAEEKPGKEHLGHAEVMLVSGTRYVPFFPSFFPNTTHTHAH